jgi:hypothetical protein
VEMILGKTSSVSRVSLKLMKQNMAKLTTSFLKLEVIKSFLNKNRQYLVQLQEEGLSSQT